MHFDTILRTVLLVLLLCGVAAFGFFGCARGKGNKPDEESFTLSFHSFDGGGPSYTVKIGDTSLLSCASERRYNKKNHEEIDGAAFDVIFTFKGLKSGSTTVTVTGESPIMETEITVYTAVVDEALNVTLTQQDETVTQRDPLQPVPQLIVHTEVAAVYPSLADTAAADEMIEQLSSGPVAATLEKADGGFIGEFSLTLPQQAETVTAEAGDILLCADGRLMFCTEKLSSAFTPLASLSETELEKLLTALNEDATVTLWVEWSE
ncbi:MAG: hypothetical protein IJU96_06860 [Clostridia bacterium]|nr:hypothetical protein [Clostridia bacterium]